MKCFQMGVFVIPEVCLIRRYGSQTTAFFSVFQCFSGYREYNKQAIVRDYAFIYEKGKKRGHSEPKIYKKYLAKGNSCSLVFHLLLF